MARKRPRNIQQLFSSQRFQRFTDFTEQHRRWQQQLQQCFAALQLAPLSQHCTVVSVRAHTLIIEVPSAAVANRLKLQQQRIITHFQDESTGQITQLELRIRPKASPSSQNPLAAAPKQPPKPPTNEPDVVAQLRAEAARCEEPLRSQLLALADKYEQQ